MQGGIRRKRDLLPRYKNGGGKRGNGFLTTPMKKILIYCSILLTFFLLFRYAYSDLNRETEYELDQMASSADRLNAAVAIAAASSQDREKEELKKASSQFNNEVAMQQEVKNLENEYNPNGAVSVPEVAGAPGSEEVKKVGSQFNNEVAMQQEVKNLENQYKPNGGATVPGPEELKKAGSQFNNEVAMQQEVKNLENQYNPNGAASVPDVAGVPGPVALAAAVGGAVGDAATEGVAGVAGRKKPEKPMKVPGQTGGKQHHQAEAAAGGIGGAKFPEV